METRFMELANTDLTDKDFFEDVFTHYIEYLYKQKTSSVQDLSRLRKHYQERDPHTLRHLRDNLESILYRHNVLAHETANAEMIEVKRNIKRLEEKLEELTRLRG
jgi:hypothetical protein